MTWKDVADMWDSCNLGYNVIYTKFPVKMKTNTETATQSGNTFIWLAMAPHLSVIYALAYQHVADSPFTSDDPPGSGSINLIPPFNGENTPIYQY